MKIEKINDNQIRCTVTMADLHDRHLKISELITNSEKAKLLLQDMVQQAAAQFGFDVDGMSLMIETAPAAKDSVVFTITRLTDGAGENTDLNETPMNKLLGADSISHFIHKLRSAVQAENNQKQTVQQMPSTCIFSFDTLEQVIQTSIVFDGLFDINTSLYKDELASCYLLVVSQKGVKEADFNRACNMLSEYAAMEETDPAILSYVREHGRMIIEGNAIEALASLH